MTTRSTRPAAALLTVAVLGLPAVLSGCGSQQAPAAPMPTTTQDTRAADFAEAEKVVRAADADLAKHGKYTDERYLYPDTILEENKVGEDWARQGLTEKGTQEIISVTPDTYSPEARDLTVLTCTKVTGGIYDKSGKNVETDSAGHPVDDKKPRRVRARLTLHRDPGANWRISTFDVLTEKC